MNAPNDTFADAAADQLGSCGFVVLDGWLGHQHTDALRAELVWMRERGLFVESRVGHGPQRQRVAGVRSDEVCWFDVNACADGQDGRRGVRPGPEVDRFFARLAGLRARLNATCFLSLTDIECHAACYEEGSSYAAHVDAFADDTRRVISFCHYLNVDWAAVHGGCLRMHGLVPTDIEPLFDRLVVFQSRQMLHEVLPVARRRLSCTGWMSTVML